MKSYVTYDDSGNLTGAYLQDMPKQHADCHIEVTDEQRLAWTTYRANPTRTGLDLALPDPWPEPTEAEIVAAYMASVQKHMDERARAFGYDDLISVITYAEEPAVPRYQAEGQAFRAWRSACWARCEELLAEVKSGQRPAPTHAELLEELPALGLEDSGLFAS